MAEPEDYYRMASYDAHTPLNNIYMDSPGHSCWERPPIYHRLGGRTNDHHHLNDNRKYYNNNNNSRNRDYYNRRNNHNNNNNNVMKRRRWGDKNSTSTSNNQSAQEVTKKVKTFNEEQSSKNNCPQPTTSCNEPNNVDDSDAEDITVEVANTTSSVQEEALVDYMPLERFKLTLDSRIQSHIKKLQTKRPNKEDIFPLTRIISNATKITLNERFTLL